MLGLIFLAVFAAWAAIITLFLWAARKRNLKEYSTKWQDKHWQRNEDENGNIYWTQIKHDDYENTH